ncbi:MAG: metallophosphoesterase [Oscillospiraceae bacterium]|nr:metallophosphoesterase [Oscillospiraceae bacterium]
MSLYAIADLHLSLGTNKPMDVFNGWDNYVQKIEENWKAVVESNDTVVIAGDISWGINLEQSKKDFEFIDKLPGKKILLKGNHDYYFATKNKIDMFFKENDFKTLNFLFNNCYEYEDYSICGTRGWVNEPGKTADKKILEREAGRLKLSLDFAKKTPIVFLHYPPIFGDSRTQEILDVLHKYEIKQVYYGHLHGRSCKYAVQGEVDGIFYKLISSDYLNFKLFKVL